MIEDLWKYKRIQKTAKKVLSEIGNFITEKSNEKVIMETCKLLLESQEIKDFWHYEYPAIVLSGKRSCIANIEEEYDPTEDFIGKNNIVTIELNPSKDSIWGDCSRTYVLENGKLQKDKKIKNEKVKSCLEILNKLQDDFKKFVKNDVTFEDIYFAMNQKILDYGYTNLNANGDIGHTITKNPEEVLFFEKGNRTKITEDFLLTFDPRIKREDFDCSLSLKNIYYLEKNTLKEL